MKVAQKFQIVFRRIFCGTKNKKKLNNYKKNLEKNILRKHLLQRGYLKGIDRTILVKYISTQEHFFRKKF